MKSESLKICVLEYELKETIKMSKKYFFWKGAATCENFLFE